MNLLLQLLLLFIYPVILFARFLNALLGRDPMRLREPSSASCWIAREAQPDSASYFSEASVAEGMGHGGFGRLGRIAQGGWAMVLTGPLGTRWKVLHSRGPRAGNSRRGLYPVVKAIIKVLDNKPYVEHDPIVGYRYAANTRRILPRPGGGSYEMVINAAGIRSTREYEKEKPPGVFRMLVLGDSYAAGQFVSNDQRFTELLERRVPHLEVINFALEGTGTDQQVLIYENVARDYDHDMVMVFPFLQNIRRNLVEARASFDAQTGAPVLRPKPRFDLQEGVLVLKGVPVPAESPTFDPNDATAPATDDRPGFSNDLKARISASPAGRFLKRLVFAVKPWSPFPEYASPTTPAWRLMEAILRRLKASAGAKPLVIVPVFYDSYVRFRMALNYLDRFRSLEGPGVQVIDLLPYFRRLGADAVRCYQQPHDCHFSAYGHLVVADALEAEMRGNLRVIS